MRGRVGGDRGKAEKLQSVISDMLDKHCTLVPTRRKTTNKLWFDKLAQKLRNAKSKRFRKGCNSWKGFRALLKNHLNMKKQVWITNKMETNWSVFKQATFETLV